MQFMCRKFLLLLFLLSCWSALSAQSPSLYFDRLTMQNGLSSNKVNCIIRDHRGFMWFGTNDGLNRYDGRNFMIFRYEAGNSSTISGNIINDILEDENGVLWIATADGGLSRYDYRLSPDKQFKQFRHKTGDSNSIPENTITSLLFDKAGYLWLGTSSMAVLRFNRFTERFDPPLLRGGIMDMTLDSRGTIWAGRMGGGMLKVDPRNLQFKMDDGYRDLYAKLPHQVVTAVYADEQYVWFGSWDKVLYRRSLAEGSEVTLQKTTDPFSFQNDEISCFTRDAQERLWIGGKLGGLHVYDPRVGTFYNYRYDPAREGTISDDCINGLYTDSKGVIWIATNRGISIHRPSQQQFQQIFLPAADSKSGGNIVIYDFYEQGDDLWIGTSEGIYIRRAGEHRFSCVPVFYKGNRLKVTRFFRDVDGTMYIGTDYSLFVLDEYSFKVTLLPNTEKDKVMGKIIDSRVVSIVRDTIDGNPALLVAPYGHFLAYYDLVEKRWISRRDSLKNVITRFNLQDNNLIRKLYKANDGRLWLTTTKHGLAVRSIKDSLTMQYHFSGSSKPGDMASDNVYDFTEDAAGNFWVSTYGGGLHSYNQQSRRFTHINASNNLLEGMKLDKKGNVWMISNGDVHKYDPLRKSYISFQVPDIEKSGGVRGELFCDRDGNMYAAGRNYFIVFNPLRVQEEHSVPQVFFTDFKIFNESFNELLQNDQIRLAYDQNYFTVEFAAPDLSARQDIRYSYMLEGRDGRWIDIGSRTSQEFSNLEAKDYVLKVRAANNSGIWNEKVATIHITIIPPFWQRWWFYGLCALLIGLIIYTIYRYRIDQLLKQQAIRNKIAQDLHDNVGSTLSSISVYSQVAKIYNEQERQGDLKQTLEKISDTSGEMISEMNDIVWAINPRHDSMETILQRMESFARPLLASKGIVFHFNVEPAIKQVNLEMTPRKNFYLIFKEAVNNALKYSQCKNLWVSISLKHHHIELSVKDDGAGFDMEKIELYASQSLSGNGLRNMEMRAAEMKGTWKISSKPGEGTVVHLRFPAG
jgi:signal transduction histidine kinase/ligand-binding sensor domain-containing protein